MPEGRQMYGCLEGFRIIILVLRAAFLQLIYHIRQMMPLHPKFLRDQGRM